VPVPPSETATGRYLLEGDERVRPDRPAGSASDDPPDDPPEVVGRTYARLIGITDDENEDE
jgi:hypothetical protein